MKIKYDGSYKSITSVEWNEIPMLVVITGPNGSGKTQLLELLNGRLAPNNFNRDKMLITYPGEFETSEINLKSSEVIFLKSSWEIHNATNITMGNLESTRNSYYEWFKTNSYAYNLQGQDYLIEAFAKPEMELGHRRSSISKDEFYQSFPRIVYQNEQSIGQKLGEIFFEYRISEIQLLANGEERSVIDETIGRKPWEVLRAIMMEAKLPFTINDPESMDIRGAFELKIRHVNLDKEINLMDLSSGEKVLFSLMLHLYNFQEKYVKPKIILMDEPDAHLHPSMAQQFINVIKNIIVEKLGIRVVLTTHSPSTVVLSPDESVFIMDITNPRIRKAKSKNEALALLTSGLVYVGPGTKYFLVEDKDDVEFYSYVYSTLVQEGLLTSEIPLVFIPASTETKSGGKDVVRGWVKKLQESGIENIINGLIDQDAGNTIFAGVKKIERYSIENYLCDPIYIFAALLDKEKAPSVPGINLKVGEEYLLKSLPAIDLQRVADHFFLEIFVILKELISDIDEQDTTVITIKFTNGIELKYPSWLIRRRGKTILNEAINKLYGSPTINRATLSKAMRKLNIFPVDLKDLFLDMMFEKVSE